MPALFLAYNYMLYVRLIMHNIGAKHSFFKPTIIAKMFVGIDVFTFIVQVSTSLHSHLCFTYSSSLRDQPLLSRLMT